MPKAKCKPYKSGIVIFIVVLFIATTADLNQRSSINENIRTNIQPIGGVKASDMSYYTFGTPNEDQGQGIWSDGTNIYTCGGYNYSEYIGGDLLLVKWDMSGNVIWNRTWDGGRYDIGRDVWGDDKGNIYTCGNMNVSYFDTDIVLIKWNSTGDLIWNRTFNCGGIGESRGIWCNETRVVVCGSIYTDWGSVMPILVEWTANGDLWINHTYSCFNMGTFEDVWGNDSVIFACGSTYNTSSLIMTLMDGDGYLQDNRSWGGHGRAIWGDASGIYVRGDMVLVKWDRELNLLWNQTWRGSGGVEAQAIWGSGSDVYVCDLFRNWSANTDDMVLTKWTANGTLLWNQTFGGSIGLYYEIGMGVWGTGSAIYTCGYTASYGAGSTDMLLVKWFGGLVSTNLTITPCADITYFANQTGNTIDWILYDSNTSVRNYAIYRDYSWLKNDSWTSGIPVICSVDNLTVGQHSYFIIASDGLGETVQDNVTVLVLPNVSPTISNPADFTFNSDTSSIISWTITDESTGTCVFQIFRDGVWLLNGTWSSSVPINFTIGGLSPGEYSYTIIAYDGLGGSYQNTVVVTVVRGNITESPPYLIIIAIICTAVGAIFAIVLVTKARSRKKASPAHDETEAARRRERKEASMYKEMPMPKVINQPQVPLAAPVPEHLAPAAPMQWRPTPALCPRCGNALPTEVGKIRFCVYCGEPIHTGNP